LSNAVERSRFLPKAKEGKRDSFLPCGARLVPIQGPNTPGKRYTAPRPRLDGELIRRANWFAARGPSPVFRKGWEPADKPGSVVGNHSSGADVTGSLERPTRKRRGQRHRFPIWSCSGWGLPCHGCCQPRGALLPHHFTLTPKPDGPARGGILSVALSVGSRPPGVTWHPALRSPDFPPRHRGDGAIAWPAPGSHCRPGRSRCKGIWNPDRALMTHYGRNIQPLLSPS
jgi:hypothetical protein